MMQSHLKHCGLHPFPYHKRSFSVLGNARNDPENRLQLFKDLRVAYISLHQVVSSATEKQLCLGWLVEKGWSKL